MIGPSAGTDTAHLAINSKLVWLASIRHSLGGSVVGGFDSGRCNSGRHQLIPLVCYVNLIRPLAKQSSLDDDNRVRDKMKIYFTLSWWSLALARQIDSQGDMESGPIG